jgi:hypothetical protein
VKFLYFAIEVSCEMTPDDDDDDCLVFDAFVCNHAIRFANVILSLFHLAHTHFFHFLYFLR